MEDVNDTIISSPATADALDEDLVLDLREVTIVRDGRHVLHPVTWQVEVDERWIIIGPNGAGKTSLLTIAGARQYPSSGTARIVGETLGKTDVRELRTAVGMSSAAVAHQVPGGEKVLDLVISAGYDVMGRWRERYDRGDELRAMEILEQMGALHLGEQTWETLSEGERKRVLIARALMTDPELLLLDEPGAGLDLGGREDLVRMLGELAEDPDAPATVMVTHHVEEIPPGFTHGMILDEGRVVAQGLLEDVMTSENLTRAYHQPISLSFDDGRYFARRARTGGSHRAR
ncbi:MAG: ABC transporter ATP-binding protein [Corynebacterium sp.]|uniref:ABC transporter ATP-binding protein n=1 Tax=unclassified Corynebacterium TaxID=2624378 RepID=UPI0026487C30|nr:ABC transporter ATP-binding protein [Corynebacterium sp.]MDN5581058.1 ABC transporter ATP-binding protein [Corynebacterium sp.]MDN5720933.1 ABC transporter ATP-binding protein [Corynebacterium sp.]MDN6259117.1 ABC transporter ATP-binding protein [Corynebacterium sp.]MDN6325891.1 ABC transporter ATP-binding protein [Corynebacterium sp.]